MSGLEVDAIYEHIDTLGQWIYDYQTIIAGLIAVFAAGVTVRRLSTQIDLQRSQQLWELQKEQRASRATLHHALSQIEDYLVRTFDALAMQNTVLPKMPIQAIDSLILAATCADKQSYETFHRLISGLQMFQSRLQVNPDKINDAWWMDRMLDLLVISCATGRLFLYARDPNHELPFEKPTEQLVQEELEWLLDWRNKEIGELGEDIRAKISNSIETRTNGDVFGKYHHVIW